ncbi:hypothetical protein PIB30_026730 [Stylosanthes scabra]|uniref:Uncharacterized protein n=1 Tax=Stylosanthes scabra TaxID=79078 RepID=A0ABU6UCE8_9FABA|nr:hypothetical protein [Stylosanthes scabra]
MLLPCEDDADQRSEDRDDNLSTNDAQTLQRRQRAENDAKRQLTRRVEDRDDAETKANLWRRQRCSGKGGFGCCLGFLTAESSLPLFFTSHI